MLIFFGHRATKIAEVSKKINDHGYPRDAVIIVFQRYAHLFWIPLFPLMRTYILFMPETGETYAHSLFHKMPQPYLSACREVGRTVKTPLWTFVGIFIFAMLIFWLESKSS